MNNEQIENLKERAQQRGALMQVHCDDVLDLIALVERATPTAAVAAGTIELTRYMPVLHPTKGPRMPQRVAAMGEHPTGAYVRHDDHLAAITAASQKAREEAADDINRHTATINRLLGEIERTMKIVRGLEAQRTAGGDAVEVVAKAIYALLPANAEGSVSDYPWQDRGNSHMQMLSRDMARAALAAQPVPETAAQGEKCDNCDGAGGWKTAEWIDPVSGPECESERCEVCMGSGIVPPDAEPIAATPAPVSAEPTDLLQRCLKAMKHAVTYGETGTGRPPQQTCMFEIEELESILSARASLPSAGAPLSGAEQALLPALKKAAKLLRAAGFTMTGTATSEIVAAITTAESCTVPPAGWQCTRVAGHAGPCAAVPVADVQELPALPKKWHERYAAARKDGNPVEARELAATCMQEEIADLRAALATAMRQQQGDDARDARRWRVATEAIEDLHGNDAAEQFFKTIDACVEKADQGLDAIRTALAAKQAGKDAP